MTNGPILSPQPNNSYGPQCPSSSDPHLVPIEAPIPSTTTTVTQNDHLSASRDITISTGVNPAHIRLFSDKRYMSYQNYVMSVMLSVMYEAEMGVESRSDTIENVFHTVWLKDFIRQNKQELVLGASHSKSQNGKKFDSERLTLSLLPQSSNSSFNNHSNSHTDESSNTTSSPLPSTPLSESTFLPPLLPVSLSQPGLTSNLPAIMNTNNNSTPNSLNLHNPTVKVLAPSGFVISRSNDEIGGYHHGSGMSPNNDPESASALHDDSEASYQHHSNQNQQTNLAHLTRLDQHQAEQQQQFSPTSTTTVTKKTTTATTTQIINPLALVAQSSNQSDLTIETSGNNTTTTLTPTPSGISSTNTTPSTYRSRIAPTNNVHNTTGRAAAVHPYFTILTNKVYRDALFAVLIYGPAPLEQLPLLVDPAFAKPLSQTQQFSTSPIILHSTAIIVGFNPLGDTRSGQFTQVLIKLIQPTSAISNQSWFNIS
jgi:hypothetical protein